MNNLPIYLLESLVAFHENGTLLAAAEKLQITQPAITKHFQMLESISKYKIFTTAGRQKKLTSYGLQLCLLAKRELQNLTNGIEILDKSYSQGSSIQLVVGGRIEFLAHFFQNTFSSLGKITFLDLSSEEVIQRMLDKKLDLAITHKRHDLLEYKQKKLGSDSSCIIIPNSWDFHSNKSIFLKNYSNWPTAIYSESLLKSSEGKNILNLFPHLKIQIEIADWTQIEDWVHKQKIWAIVPKLFLRKDRDYKIIEEENLKLNFDYYLYYRPEFTKLTWFKNTLSEIEKIYNYLTFE